MLMRMRNLSRTCLILCACCIIALRALAIRKRDEDNRASNETDDFDFELFDDENEDDADENLDDEVEELVGHTKGKAVAAAVKLPRRRLEPEAEMLPANYEGVKPPGVDHMEMTREVKNILPRNVPIDEGKKPLPAARSQSTLRRTDELPALKYRFAEV